MADRATEPISKQPSTKGSAQTSTKESTQTSTKGSTQTSTKGSTQPAGKGSTQSTAKGSTQPSSKGSTQPSSKGSTQITAKESTQPSTTVESTQPSTKEATQTSTKGCTPKSVTLEESASTGATPTGSTPKESTPKGSTKGTTPRDEPIEQDADEMDDQATSPGAKTSPEPAESETSEGDSPTHESDSTAAPGVGDSQYTTTSMVTTTGSTEKSSTKKRRGMSKMEAAKVYVYGHVEEPWQRRDIKPSSESDVTVRLNRAQTMRQSCILRRAKMNEKSCGMSRSNDVSKSDDSESDRKQVGNMRQGSQSGDDEEPVPIIARKVPKNIYDTPKVPIKETKSSKFRYLYNRKPAGVKVYFKPLNADPKKKPPFVV